MNKLNVTSLALSLTLFNLLCFSCSTKRLFLCLDSFILSLISSCLCKNCSTNCQAIAVTDTTYCCYGISYLYQPVSSHSVSNSIRC